MLDHTRLLGKLREFCDKDYAQFRAMPTHRDQARQEWAAAFFDYFDQMVEDITTPSPPNHASMSTAAVENAFYGDLGLEESISAAQSAADFAGAWRVGVTAVTAGGAVTDASMTAYTWVSWSNVGPMHDALLATLTALFEAPSTTMVPRLTEIAQAFHTASDGLIATVTSLTSGGSPGPTTMAIK